MMKNFKNIIYIHLNSGNNGNNGNKTAEME
jgi:hypothetical protein